MAKDAEKPTAKTEEAGADARAREELRATPGSDESPSATADDCEAAKTDAAPADADGKSARPDTASKKSSASERAEPTLKLPSAQKRDPKIVAAAATNKDTPDKPTVLAKAATMFGNLDADHRIRKAAEQNERLLWTGAAGATLIYALLIASQAMTGMLVPLEQLRQQQERERRGQNGNTISVEIVPEPDRNAKTRKWRDGSEVPVQQQTPDMPQMPQTAALPQPQNEAEREAETEAEKEPSKDEAKNNDQKRPDDAPMLLDIDSLVDAAAADLKQQIDRHYDRRPQRRQRQAATGAVKVRGSGASGKSDPFTDSVIAALMKSRPGPVALWGRVLVSFQIGRDGNLLYVKVLQSSGNSAMDQAAVDAIRRARFKRPPPELTAEQRTYIIDYIFG